MLFLLNLLFAEFAATSPVRVVDEGVERLIDPLPEDDGGGALIESHHAPSDKHVTGYLGRHSAYQIHFLPGLRMKRRIVQHFRPP